MIHARQTPHHCFSDNRSGIALATALFALFVTCGCSDGLETYPVTGRVHFPDGTPLEGGIIIFVSDETGVQSRARIERDGTFTLGTLSNDDGSVLGLHRVSVRPEVLGFGAPPKQPILRKYHAAKSSGLEFMVRADAPNEFDIVVERDASRAASTGLQDR